MNIYEFSPFHNENEVLELKVLEGLDWIKKIFIIESNKTFQGDIKLSNFKNNIIYENIVSSVFIDFSDGFKKNRLLDI